MSVGLILNLLNELNKRIKVCMSLVSKHNIILFNEFNKFINRHEFNILFITYPKRTLNCKNKIIFIRHAYHNAYV